MGSIQNVIGMLPGMPKEVRKAEIDDREIIRIEAIIQSMTPDERRKPDMINGSRRGRIAKGAGVNTADVNNLLKQFKQVQQMMRSMGRGKGGKKNKRGGLPVGMGLDDLPGLPGR
jgi:signal recognition particle subunit SRP54